MDIDFYEISAKHTQWRVRLLNFLLGQESLTLEQAGTHRDCALGKWIHSEGLVKYGDHPQMRDLMKAHREMHEAVLTTIRAEQAGRRDAANAALAAVDSRSRKVVELILAVESIVTNAISR